MHETSINHSDAQLAYSIKQIAKLTTISRSKIFEEIRDGNLKTFKCGRRTLATLAAIEEWLK
jgi:excisionase family DNA binding protein